MLRRRGLLRGLPAAGLLVAAAPATAQVTVRELALACDITLAPALRAVGVAYAGSNGVRVSVFATEPGLIQPQLARSVQNDIVVTGRATLQALAADGLLAPDAVRGAWRNPMVLAARTGTAAPLEGPIAVTDPTAASGIDGPAMLAALGLQQVKVVGLIDTDAVAAALNDGSANAGLLYSTDVRAHPKLQVISVVPAAVAPVPIYGAAVTQLARRPKPETFIEFLTGSTAAAILQAHGLET